jgi:hypothetical protein
MRQAEENDATLRLLWSVSAFGIDAEPFGEVGLDRPVALLHLIEGGFQVLGLDPKTASATARLPPGATKPLIALANCESTPMQCKLLPSPGQLFNPQRVGVVLQFVCA